jgi:hypothetical protein
MPRSPGGVSRVAHAACPAAPLYDPPDTARRATCSCPAEPAKELSGRSARSLGAGEPAAQSAPGTGWKPWNRRRDARREPGGNLALLW